MPQPKKVDRPVRIEVQIPTSVLSLVHLELHSDLEGRIPWGKRSELMTQLLTKWLREERGLIL